MFGQIVAQAFPTICVFWWAGSVGHSERQNLICHRAVVREAGMARRQHDRPENAKYVRQTKNGL